MHHRGEELCFYWTEKDSGSDGGLQEKRTLYLWASPVLAENVDGGVMAVLLDLCLTEGWEISEAEGIFQGEELRITVGKERLLLDGILKEGNRGEDCCLAEVEVEWKGGGSAKMPLCVRWIPDPTACLYVKNQDQGTKAYSFHVCGGDFGSGSDTIENSTVGSTGEAPPETIPAADTNEMCPNTECPNTAASPDTTCPSATGSAEPPTEETGSDPLEPEMARYLGCQETPVRDGEYAVRLLFCGGELPWILVEGGGVLYGEVTQGHRVEVWQGGVCTDYIPPGGEVVTALTLRGLQAGKEYRFTIHTDNGGIRIRYVDGQFVDLGSKWGG